MRLSRALRLFSLVLVLTTVASSCRSVEGTRGLPPLFEIYDSPSLETRDAIRETYVRPLFSYEDLGDDHWAVEYLKPFGRLRFIDNREEVSFDPIWRYHARRYLDGSENIDWLLFPILFGGSDPKKGAYFAIFPLGGRVRGLLGQEVIDFALFPLWARAEWQGRTSQSILWPLFNVVSGGGWSGGRAFPFYSEYAWDNADGSPRARRLVMMWPFWIENDSWHRGERTSAFFTVPFYGIRENRRSKTETIFWPFYVAHYDKLRDEELVGGYFFPYRFGKDQFDPWPFFGIKETVDLDRAEKKVERERFRQFAVWPIQRYDWSRDIREETSRFWLLPFYWRYRTEDLVDGHVGEKWKLWPLLGYERDGDESRWELLSPLWLHRKDWDRFYGRLFSVFRQRSTAAYWGWELLWGTIYWGEGDPTAESSRSLDRAPEASDDDYLFSLLGGLLEYGSADDKLVLRILWIPWW